SRTGGWRATWKRPRSAEGAGPGSPEKHPGPARGSEAEQALQLVPGPGRALRGGDLRLVDVRPVEVGPVLGRLTVLERHGERARLAQARRLGCVRGHRVGGLRRLRLAGRERAEPVAEVAADEVAALGVRPGLLAV